jgi:hypothetical protein
VSLIRENHHQEAVQAWLQKEKKEKKKGNRRENRRRKEKLHYRSCHAEIIFILHTGVQKDNHHE